MTISAFRLYNYFIEVRRSTKMKNHIASTQVTFRAGAAERRPDLVLYVNGIPLALLEANPPVRNAVSWVDGAKQLHDDNEKFIPELFACNVLNIATEGKALLDLARDLINAEKEVPAQKTKNAAKTPSPNSSNSRATPTPHYGRTHRRRHRPPNPLPRLAVHRGREAGSQEGSAPHAGEI
jgi:hypothetical protein